MGRDRIISFLLLAFCFCHLAFGQRAFDFISYNRNFSASNYCIYPDSIEPVMTAPPAGKKPFYISHYGRHGSRYLSNRKGYDIPYRMLCRADSMGKLTETGKRVLQELEVIIEDSDGRWGDLSGLGKQQHRNIARRMMERFPEVFKGKAFVDARSTTVNRCILSMGAAVQQLVALNPKLQVKMEASKRDMWYMNHQDQSLRDSMMTPASQKAYDEFCAPRKYNPRLMELLFVHPDSVTKVVDEVWLNYYLILTGLIQQNTHMSVNEYILNRFPFEEIHRFWQNENAWWYINYGPSPLNGGCQPYTQRDLLRKMIEETDSCIRLRPLVRGATLRFGHETIVLPLACLLGINGFDYQTTNLELLEDAGWWAGLVFPMASNIQFVFYRKNPGDHDILFKVLLNEREARLPLPDNSMAPYYRWKDFREYYLKKIDAYEK